MFYNEITKRKKTIPINKEIKQSQNDKKIVENIKEINYVTIIFDKIDIIQPELQ